MSAETITARTARFRAHAAFWRVQADLDAESYPTLAATYRDMAELADALAERLARISALEEAPS